jgi:hypothetical protein
MKSTRSSRRDQPARRLTPRDDRPVAEPEGGQFRRNRTLSGVQREAAAEARSPRAQLHSLTQRRRKVGGILLLIIVASVLLLLLVTQFTARPVISGASSSLNTQPETATYEAAINDYFGLHPVERLRFAMNERSLSDYVATVTPEVSAVTQSGTENISDTHFTLTFRQPVAGWYINGQQYYVDESGVVFDKNYFATPTVQIVDESGVSPEQGTTVASARLLSFVGRVVALTKQGGREVREVVLPVATTRQLDIRLAGVEPRVKFSIDRGAGEQVEDMLRILNYLSARNVTGTQYIDVRIAGRAVYL